MNEERYAFRVRQALNHGLKDIPPAASRRLEAARNIALSKQKMMLLPVMELAESGSISRISPRVHLPYFKQLLAIIALLFGMWISFYWHSSQYIGELEEVDSALLADDLPPEAFLDKDFFKWLLDDSQEE